jgi:hypothetical protein
MRTMLAALLALFIFTAQAQVQPPVNPHVDCNSTTHNCRIHYLLPGASFYDLTQALTHNVDIPYAMLDPNGWSNHLTIKKAMLTLDGPQVWNMGGAMLILEDNDADTRAGAVWDPFIKLEDGFGYRSEIYPDGIRMTSSQQLCFEYKNRAYSTGVSWNMGTNLYRSVWVDLWYHVGD